MPENKHPPLPSPPFQPPPTPPRAALHLKAYLRVSSRALNRARYEREIGDFRGRRSPFAFCNPLSGNRDVSDGKFSSVRFSFLHIIIYSFMFHVARIAIDMPVQLFHGFRRSRVSSTKLAITCPVPLSPSPPLPRVA